MPSPVPTPVAAVLGLVPTVLDGVRALPLKVVQLPVFAISSVLSGLDGARRGYDDLAGRGERLLASLRGTSLDELEDRVEDAVQGTRLARPYDRVEDALEEAAETVTAFARSPRATTERAARAVRSSAGKGLESAADAVEDLAARTAGDDAQRPGTDGAGGAGDAAAAASDEPSASAGAAAGTASKGRATPKATGRDGARVGTAAADDVVATVERVSAVIGGAVLPHDELPLPDYDHLTLGAVRGRMRSLDLPALVQLRDYEKSRANRLPVVTMLDNRIAKLASDPTAPLSGGGAGQPAASATVAPASKASPSTAASTPTTPPVAHGGLGGSQTR